MRWGWGVQGWEQAQVIHSTQTPLSLIHPSVGKSCIDSLPQTHLSQ